jgi:hypothetical protein
VVQHQAAGAFEVAAGLFVVREIQHACDLETRIPGDGLDDLGPALHAPILGVHGIQHHGAIRMEAHPVVGKHGVGFARAVGVLGHADSDALALERGHERIEFRERP